ncbi:hypothetical protein Vafri_20654, partial [Volvox africanus]
ASGGGTYGGRFVSVIGGCCDGGSHSSGGCSNGSGDIDIGDCGGRGDGGLGNVGGGGGGGGCGRPLTDWGQQAPVLLLLLNMAARHVPGGLPSGAIHSSSSV